MAQDRAVLSVVSLAWLVIAWRASFTTDTWLASFPMRTVGRATCPSRVSRMLDLNLFVIWVSLVTRACGQVIAQISWSRTLLVIPPLLPAAA